MLPNGPEMATAFIAIASGAASAPLNPGYRADEFEFYMSDLNAKALVVEAGSASPALAAAKKLGITVLTLTPDPERGSRSLRALGGKAMAPPRCRAAPSAGRRRADPAYLRDDVAPENRAADAGQCREIRRQHRDEP